MVRFDCLERPLARFFTGYGRCVGRNPYVFIIFPLLMTAAMSLGILRMHVVSDAVYLFTPTGAPSKYERQTVFEHWPQFEDNYIPGRAVSDMRETQVIVIAKDGGNILEPQYTKAIDKLDKFIQKEIKVEFEGRKWGYEDLCLHWRNQSCPGNTHVDLVSGLYNSGFNLTYPSLRVGSKHSYLGAALGGVTLTNDSTDGSRIASAEAWFMLYHLKFSPDNTSFVSGLWEMELQRRLMEYPEDRHIRFTFFHSMSLSNEISRNADTLAPLFIIAVVFLMFFSVLCNMRLVPGTLYVDWVLSKPTLAMLGVLNAGMGALTSVGFLCFIGVTYTQIIGVMPFICLSVGVNNMFILVGALQATNRAHPVEERMSEAASEAAVAITITMLTDMLSYGVGCYTAPNAVLLFCIYSGVAVTITFFYQVSFFLGLLAVSARLEESGRHCMFFFKTVSTDDYKSQSIFVKLFMLGSRPHPDSHHQKMNQPDTTMIVFFRDVFAPFLMQPIVKGVVIVWIFIYLAIATYGCINVRLGLKPVNLLVADSYARPHYAALEDYFWKYGTQLQIVVNNAPDLRDPKERANIKAMVQAFANTPHSIGDDGVQFWMDEVTYFYQHEYNTSLLDPAAYHMIEHFMELPEYETWSEDISWESDVEIGPDDVRRIKAFRFLVGLREFAETTQQMETTTIMRNLAEEYPQYNVTTFMPLWLFIDQYMQVLPNVIQDIYLAIATMIMIALLLIPQPLCALWVALAIISIDVGVIGYMTLWGVNLDAISMINLVISIGFSVDFSAHVTYGYVVSNEDNPTDRVRMALSELGWPVVQGGVSTLLGMCMLATVDAYMIVTFFKTVVLVITIGLLHALVFLPVLLSMFIRGFCLFGNDKSLSLSTLSLPKMMKKRKVKPSPIVLAPMLGNIEYPSNLLQDRYSHSARSFLEPAHLATVRSVPPSHMRYFDWPAVPASHATRSVHHASRL